MENPIKMDDLGIPLFLETTISPTQPILEIQGSGIVIDAGCQPLFFGNWVRVFTMVFVSGVIKCQLVHLDILQVSWLQAADSRLCFPKNGTKNFDVIKYLKKKTVLSSRNETGIWFLPKMGMVDFFYG